VDQIPSALQRPVQRDDARTFFERLGWFDQLVFDISPRS